MRIQRISEETHHEPEASPDLSVLEPIIQKYKESAGSLIPLLQETQRELGYIPREAFDKIASEAGIEPSEMYGVATFYSQFRLNPVGKHIIKVCHGTACHVQNANTITEALEDSLKIKDGETTEDGVFTLESVACLGCCSLAPVMMISDETYGKLSKKQAVKVIKDIRIQEKNQEPQKTNNNE